MLDLILGPFLEYGPLGDLNKTSVDGKKEVWYNSKTDITFGDSNTWLIGLGRTTNICGPDIKVVADWTFIEELLSEKFNHKFSGALGQTIGALLFGVGGASDVLFGVKNLINYGDTQDTTVIRKHTAPLEIKIFKDKLNAGESLFPTDLVLLIVLPYLLLLTMVVTIRFANMQVGVFAEESTREKVAKALSVLAPLVESRWIALLLVYEKLTYTAKQLKESTIEIAQKIKDLQDFVQDTTAKLTAQATNILITDEVKKEIEAQTEIINEYLSGNTKHTKNEFEKAIDSLKISAPLLGPLSQEYKRSNSRLDSSYLKLTYNAIEAIQLNATEVESDPLTGNLLKVKSNSFFNLTPTALDFKAPGTLFQFGKISSQEGSINISFSGSENNAFMKLGADGSSLSNITIRNEDLQIQSGKTNNENPTIKLKEGSLKIRCGPALTGPQILFDNGKVTITAGEQILGAGPKFVMTNDSIELKVGELSALKITSDGVEIKCGEAASTKWSVAGVKMKAAESEINALLAAVDCKTAILKLESEAIGDIKALALQLNANTMLALKAALKMY
jgi:hypothetical protein